MARQVFKCIVYGWNAMMLALFAYLLGGGAVVSTALEGYRFPLAVAAFLLTLAIAAAGNIVFGVLWLVSGK